jgi:hypothetical protein
VDGGGKGVGGHPLNYDQFEGCDDLIEVNHGVYI